MAKQAVVVITGGSSGIGLALAAEYLRRGARVAITGRDAARLEDAQITLQAGISEPGHLMVIQADAASEADAARTAAQVEATFGPATILICNAGISMRAMFAEVEMSVIRQLMEVNFFGTVYTTKAFLPQLLATRGSIVAISSIAGHRGLPARTGYSASKAAVQGFMEALRTELLHSGVHVLVACPGFTASAIRQAALTANGTPQGKSPLEEGKIMPAVEVATAIAHAVADRRRDLVLTTQGRFTVWLNKLFPGWMDRQVYRHFSKEAGTPLGS